MMGLTPWVGLGVAVNPGLVYAATVSTPETVGVAVMALGLLAWLRDRWWTAAILFVVLCFIKEAFVFVPIGLAIWELIRRARGDRKRDVTFLVGVLALGPLSLAAWFVYLYRTLGAWPFAQGPRNITTPILGWFETLSFSAQQIEGPGFQVGSAGVPLIIAVGVGLACCMFKASKMRSPIDPIFMMSAGLIFCLSWLALLYPKDLIRNISPVVFLAPYLWARWGPEATAEP